MAKEHYVKSPTENESVASLDSTGKQKSFRRLFARFGEKTSMTGVPYIYLAKLWWAKAIWSFLLLCALVAMGLHLWFLFDQWYSFPKNTKVELGFQPLEFPQVTICNTNIMHKQRFDNFNGVDYLQNLVDKLRPENLVSDQFNENYTFATEATEAPSIAATTTETPDENDSNINRRRKRYVDEYKKINISNYDDDEGGDYDDYYDEDDYYVADQDEQAYLRDLITELYMTIDKHDREALGHDIFDMLVDCTFNGRKCTANQFKLHQTSQYGNCWTISDKKFKVRKAGPLTGLSLTLFLETNQYLSGISNGYGLRVSVQQPSTYPFPADEGIFMPASMESDIALKLVNITRLGGNFGQCDDGVEFRKVYNMSYTRRACQSFCQMSTVIKTCACFDLDWEEYAFVDNPKLKPCTSNKEEACVDRVLAQYAQGNLTCTCHNPCSEYSYVQDISQRQWPSNEYARVLLEWVCNKDQEICKTLRDELDDLWAVNNNFLKLNVYFKDLNYEKITEEPQIEVQQFLSDVGGAIGLWIGLSILSLCELIQLIMELCYYAGHKIQKQSKSDRKRHNQNRRENGVNNQANFKENRWPNTASNYNRRPYNTGNMSSDRGYHSDNDRRYHGERYDDIRHVPNLYDDIPERYSDYRDVCRHESHPYPDY